MCRAVSPHSSFSVASETSSYPVQPFPQVLESDPCWIRARSGLRSIQAVLRCDCELQQSRALCTVPTQVSPPCPPAAAAPPLCSVADSGLLSWALITIILPGKKKPSPFLRLTQQSCLFWTIWVLPFIPISFHSLLPFQE